MSDVRSIEDCLKVSSKSLSDDEVIMINNWLNTSARYEYDSYKYSCLLGWFLLDDFTVPLSPKEAGFD